MIFVPLTFVTSVFGMTNMDTTPHFWQFGVTLVTVCIPFFLLIGFLNTDSGYRIWMEKTKALWHWIRPRAKKLKADVQGQAEKEREYDLRMHRTMSRSSTTEEGMRRRFADVGKRARRESSVGPQAPEGLAHIRRIIEEVREGKQGGRGSRSRDCGMCEEGNSGEEAENNDGTYASQDVVIDIDGDTK